MKVDDENLGHLIHEAEIRIQIIKKSLPVEIHAGGVSTIAKTPYKLLIFREALIWRLAETSEVALSLFKDRKHVSAIIMIRSVIECAAACWFILELIEEYQEKRSLTKLDEKVTRLLMGQKWNSELPSAVHINDMLRSADKTVTGMFKSYDIMSEYAHPNWSGVFGMYGKRGGEDYIALFGENIRKGDGVLKVGINGLLGALTAFEFAYNRISDLMPEFVESCEDDVTKL